MSTLLLEEWYREVKYLYIAGNTLATTGKMISNYGKQAVKQREYVIEQLQNSSSHVAKV